MICGFPNVSGNPYPGIFCAVSYLDNDGEAGLVNMQSVKLELLTSFQDTNYRNPNICVSVYENNFAISTDCNISFVTSFQKTNHGNSNICVSMSCGNNFDFSNDCNIWFIASQPAFTCSKLTIETLEQGLEYN